MIQAFLNHANIASQQVESVVEAVRVFGGRVGAVETDLLDRAVE